MPQNAAPANTRRVLVVAPPGTSPDRAALAEGVETERVESLTQAVEAIDAGGVDQVVLAGPDLRWLAHAIREHDVRRVFADLTQPVAIVSAARGTEWTNARLASYPPAVADAVRDRCLETLKTLQADAALGKPLGGRPVTLQIGRDFHFEMSVSPLAGAGPEVDSVVGVAWDVSRAQRLQETINALDTAGRSIVAIDPQAISNWDVGERLQLLEDKIVSVAHDLLHFDHFVVRVLNPRDDSLEAVIANGLPDEAVMARFLVGADGQGITGWVAATGRSYICADAEKDSRYRPGLDQAGSSLTVPLLLSDRVIGVLNVEAHAKSAFSEDDRQFAEILAGYVAMALHILNLLVVERHTTTGHIAADVDSESAVALNQIVTDVSSIMVDFPDLKLQGRLRQIIADVDKVREAIHAVTDPGAITGLVPESGERDPLIAGRRILIAEDEEIIRETIAEVLAKCGAITTLAADGAIAVRTLEQRPFDLVLTDIKMPNRNGYEVFAAARRSNARCGVILMTGFGYDPNHAIVRASREGLSGVLFKPFKVEKLLEDVRNALHNPLGTK